MRRNTKQAAREGKCSPQTIVRLLQNNKLNGHKNGKNWVVTGTKEEIATAVNVNCPKHGWHRKTRRTQPALPFGGAAVPFTPSPANDAGFTGQPVIAASVPVSDLTFWIGLSQDRRDLLRYLHTITHQDVLARRQE